MLNAHEFTEMLQELLLTEGLGEAEFESATFQDTGLLTRDQGLVVQFLSGDEFQLTIVKSAFGPEPEPESEAPYDAAPRFVAKTGGRS